MLKFEICRTSGFNRDAFIKGPLWYMKRGLKSPASLMLLLCIVTAGIAAVPVWVYCGMYANRDLFQHVRKRGIPLR